MLLLLLFGLKFVKGEGQFECGEHGRFEYCIDEIPGCVIGCHCHPGYYFDTESKICEPNSKLTLNYRRNYQTNANILISTETPYEFIEITETLTTPDPIDNQVDEITKNTDDLGDWLYNQFFKTIENQVINKTKENNVPSRRSGISPLIQNINRKRSSRKKSNQAKRRKKKSSIRRKLLRITEDDSVFDSESDESQSDSSDSSSEKSEASYEVIQNEDKHKGDKEHGHKKIVIINKKPKPPLPSFIFLPNMDTPFYPPIGLPPPPIMPMYPMVPVPPMPAYPCPEQEENETTKSVITSTLSTTKLTTNSASIQTVASTISSSTVIEQNTETATNSETTTAPSKLIRAGRFKKRNRPKLFQHQNINTDTYNGLSNNPQQAHREKLLQRFRQKNNNPTLKRPFQAEEITENPVFEDNGFDDTFNNEIQSRPNINTNSRPDNVDFKYISELIHRVKLNNTPVVNNLFKPSDSIETYKPMGQFKRHGSNNPMESRRESSDDSYYTNLGRQIASIIRSADTQNQQVNIEIEQSNQNNEDHVFYNDNSPKSFWERSIRSPIKFLNSNRNKFDYLKKSNEVLFDIENKVSIVASTVPSLTLQEIENMINVMQNAQKKINNKHIDIKNTKATNNLNVNLWPQEIERTQDHLKLQATPVLMEAQHRNVNKINEMHGVSVQNVQRFTAWLSTVNKNHTQNKMYNMRVRTAAKNIYPRPSRTQISMPLKQLKNQQFNTSKVLNSPLIIDRHSFNSMLPNYKHNMERKKYFQGYGNVRDYDESLFPMKPTVRRLRHKQVAQQPSYFRQDIDHFDIFK